METDDVKVLEHKPLPDSEKSRLAKQESVVSQHSGKQVTINESSIKKVPTFATSPKKQVQAAASSSFQATGGGPDRKGYYLNAQTFLTGVAPGDAKQRKAWEDSKHGQDINVNYGRLTNMIT